MSEIEIQFYFAELNNETMSVRIEHNNISHVISNQSELVTYKSELNLPTKLTIDIFGKNMDTDTIVDGNGKIIKDKHVAIKKVLLDGIPLSPRVLYKFFTSQCDYTYIGFNSSICVNLDKANIFFQVTEMERSAA